MDLFSFDLARDFIGVFFLPSPSVSITTSIVVAYMCRVLSIFTSRSLYFGEVFFISVLFREMLLSKGTEMSMSREDLFCPSLSSISLVMLQRILASFSVAIERSCLKCFL